MDQHDYIRLVVKMNSRADITNWPAADIKAAFWLCPPAQIGMDEFVGIMESLSAPAQLTDEQKLQANAEAMASFPKGIRDSKPKES